jgi:hypothetical protein
MITKEITYILDKINAEPVIKIRKNASAISKGCPLRRDEVLLIRKLGYDGWKDLKEARECVCIR